MSLKAVVEFINGTEEASEEIGKFIDRAVKKSTFTMEKNIKQNTPVVHGTLRRSIQSRFPEFAKGEVFSSSNFAVDVGYAVFVEYGTKYFAPRGMFRKGVEQSKEKIQEIFADEAKNVKLSITQ